MNLQISPKSLFCAFLLTTSSIYIKGLTEPKKETPIEQVKPVEEFVEESSSEDFQTTTESTTTIETYQKLTVSISGKDNISREFRPSVHLGEIKESRISSGPFNNLHHFNFDNGVDPSSYHEQLKDVQVVFQPTGQNLQADYQGNFHQNLYETAAVSSEESKKQGAEQSGYVKFQDNALDVPRVQYGSLLNDPAIHQQLAQSVTENAGTQYDLVDQQVFQNLQKPVFEQQATAVWGKPSKFQGEAQTHEAGSFSNVDSLKTPYYAGFYDHQNQQSSLQDFQLFKKPSNGVVYVQEASFLRTRKFPYPIYQPQIGYPQVEFVHQERPTYPVKKRISPWKKILHLIGAILPLGLILAALTPNIVKVGNTTQPNIVLSKWRVADLPVEHKQARFTDTSKTCEERSICDMILAGGDAGSTALQNILWNLATRDIGAFLIASQPVDDVYAITEVEQLGTSTAMAKESGLHEVFEAVKKKDCTNVPC